MRRTGNLWPLTAAAMLALAGPAGAWHGKGHHRATRLAVSVLPDEAPRFLRQGADTVAHCAVDPDLFRKPLAAEELDRAEGPQHYLDLENLRGRDLPRHRYELLTWCGKEGIDPATVGLLPYTVTEWTQRLTVTLAEHRRWPKNRHIQHKALVYAGLLCHYAQDLCMPLHTTVHHNGRARPDGSSPKSGIHLKVDNLLEKVPEDAAVEIAPEAVRPFEEIWPAVVAELKASHALVDKVYELESQLPAYGEPIKPGTAVAEFTRQRLRAAALFTARLILTAWRDSAAVEIPEWHVRPAGPATAPADDPTGGQKPPPEGAAPPRPGQAGPLRASRALTFSGQNHAGLQGRAQGRDLALPGRLLPPRGWRLRPGGSHRRPRRPPRPADTATTVGTVTP